MITHDYAVSPGTTDIALKDGAIDRVYSTGSNPDPDGSGPPDLPKPKRRDFPFDDKDFDDYF